MKIKDHNKDSSKGCDLTLSSLTIKFISLETSPYRNNIHKKSNKNQLKNLQIKS
jgi:hypothetical protein